MILTAGLVGFPDSGMLRRPELVSLRREKEYSKVLPIFRVCRGSRLKRRWRLAEPVQASWRGPEFGNADVGNLTRLWELSAAIVP